ncbi:hypothetical protein SLS58_007352 [Diplodia intermedia]|uniref:Uncharacterized protein n=1 Tax=Diplodia intermedia TaxID=856260 RepID=A0ABR3TKL2_9PEZI
MAEEIKLLPFSEYPLNLPDESALGLDRFHYQDRLIKHIRSISAKKTVNFRVFASSPDAELPTQHIIEDEQNARQAISKLSYQFKYAEPNNRSRAFPWTIRRTEVFNRFETTTREGGATRCTWLLFHPKEDSALSKRLARAAERPAEWRALNANPLRLHIAILAAYIDNWRDFLNDIGKQYSDLKKLVWTADISHDDGNGNGGGGGGNGGGAGALSEALSFQSMRSLRGLEERVQTVPVTLRQTERLVRKLQQLDRCMLQQASYARAEHDATANALAAVAVRLEGYQTAARALEMRIQGILRLVTDALNVKNQNAAARVQKFAADNQAVSTEISKGVYALARDSVDDSTIARIVTLATLIYLPASFVASLFGMNFFDFDEESNRMNMSKDAWIYLLVTIPLTAVTGLAWWHAARIQRMKRASRRRQPPDV